jgi:RNA polymerase sigma-70 factor (ECF subfamily)
MGNLAELAFRRHYGDVYRFVRRRSPSWVDAEDVTAEVFADAAKGLDRFEPGATPVLAWLYTVAQRRLADEARRRAGAPPPEIVREEREYGPSVTAALRNALGSLPETQRAVVVLKLVEGRSFREVAERLELTEAACKMRFSRALERLREELEKEGVEP